MKFTNYQKVINAVGFGAVSLILVAGLSVLFSIGGSQLDVSATLKLGDEQFKVAVADTQVERYRGLSGTSKLDDDEGMWFVFNQPSKYGFVMRDMNYSIDIIWVDENKIIVGAAENAQPESYPEIVFNPPSAIQYVLEVSAGTVDKLDIEPGLKIEGPN